MAEQKFDLILTGLQSDDQGHAQFGPVLAEKLGIPHSTIIMEVTRGWRERCASSASSKAAGSSTSTMPLPALLTIQSGINQLRYATLKGIMAAKKKEIAKVAAPAGLAPRQKIVALYAPQKVEADGDDRRLARGSREGTGQAAARRSEGPVILVIAEQQDGKLNRASLGDDRRGAATGGRRHADQGRRRRAGRLRRRRGAGAGGRRRSASPSSTPALAHYTPDGVRAGAAAGDRAGVAGAACSCRTPIRRATSRRRWRRASIARSSPT